MATHHRSRTAGALVAGVVVAVLTASAVAPGAGLGLANAGEEERLEQTRQRISTIRAELESARAQKEQDAAALAEAEDRLREVLDAVSAAEQAVQRQQQAVEQARTELAGLQEQVKKQRQATRARALSLYKRGSASIPAGSVLEADSPQEALRRSSYVALAAKADRRIVEDLAATGTAVDAKREELEEEQATLDRVLEQRKAIMAEVKSLRDERAVQLASSQQEVSELEAQERHLESESRELASLARRAQRMEAARASRAGGGAAGDAAEAAASAAQEVTPSASGWTWPASGPVTSSYGLRWGRRHEGIDIGAGTGAPIVAARSGTVTSAGRRGGYGNMTMINHGGGITTVYAHQSSIGVSPGQQVGAGQRIGSVGCSGSCTGPHLHFEVRVNGSPRNPNSYLP